MPIKLKEEHRSTKVAFGKSAAPLGERDDIYVLAKLGRERNRQLLQYFEDADNITDEDIDNAEAEFFDKQQMKKAAIAEERRLQIEASKKKK